MMQLGMEKKDGKMENNGVLVEVGMIGMQKLGRAVFIAYTQQMANELKKGEWDMID